MIFFQGHSHNLLELEAEKFRSTASSAIQNLKKFMSDVEETMRRLRKQITTNCQ